VKEDILKSSSGQHYKIFAMELKGQSFLLNQIRKMLGLAIEVYRGTAPSNAIEECLKTSEKRYIHLAPPEGLLLLKPEYKRYNAYRVGPPSNTPPLDLSTIDAEITAFKQNNLYPKMFEAIQGGIWEKWLRILSKYPFNTAGIPSEIMNKGASELYPDSVDTPLWKEEEILPDASATRLSNEESSEIKKP
ncbi:tRna pseudouridine synthase, partial [Cardiosporidium cionae]